jgi:hypothetical protein
MACPEACVGWGVPLTGGVGWTTHPSILGKADSPLLDCEPLGEGDDGERYHLLLAVEWTGYANYPRSGYAVYVKRTLGRTADSTGDVDPAQLTPPTPGELETLSRYLDELGFTGDRTVRLLLAAKEV